MPNFSKIVQQFRQRPRLPNRVRARVLNLVWAEFGEELGTATPVLPQRWARKGYDHEAEAREAIRRVAGFTQLSYERLVTLYEQVLHIERNRLPGALVECGVWRGGSAAMMALANMAAGRERRALHLFDSFQGMPEPRLDRDGQNALKWAGQRGDGSLVSTGVNAASAGEVRRLFRDQIGYPAPFLFIHEGWFQDTLPLARQQIGPIALLRLDGDWYESTKVALEALYELVVPGGIVVIDDYGTFQGCRSAIDEFLEAHEPGTYLHYVDLSGRYFIKPSA